MFSIGVKKSRVFKLIAGTTVAYLAYDKLYSSRSQYPPEVRKPLRHALFLKHKRIKTQEQIESAEVAFKDALNAFPQENRKSKAFIGILVELANYYKNNNRIEESIKTFKEAIQLIPSNEHKYKAQIYYHLAQVHLQTNQYKEAENCLNKSIDLFLADSFDAQLMECFDTLAELFMKQGKWNQAFQAYLGMQNLCELEQQKLKNGSWISLHQLNCQASYASNALADVSYRVGLKSDALKWIRKAQVLNEEGMKYSFIWKYFDFETFKLCSFCQQAISYNKQQLTSTKGVF
jgi:tetratricopeptide (TPR) repeat protein